MELKQGREFWVLPGAPKTKEHRERDNNALWSFRLIGYPVLARNGEERVGWRLRPPPRERQLPHNRSLSHVAINSHLCPRVGFIKKCPHCRMAPAHTNIGQESMSETIIFIIQQYVKYNLINNCFAQKLPLRRFLIGKIHIFQERLQNIARAYYLKQEPAFYTTIILVIKYAVPTKSLTVRMQLKPLKSNSN